MNHDLQKIEGLRRSLAATLMRAGEIIAEPPSTYAAFPYSCEQATILFAQRLAQEAQEIVKRACEQVAILPQTLQQPISELHGMYIDGQCQRQVKHNGASPDAAAQANYALAVRLSGIACEMLTLAQECLDGNRSIDGREIKHGPLWDK